MVRTKGYQQASETGPYNTKMIVRKQKMFKDAIQATKEKLATLKTAAQQANEQLVNGEITRQQYDTLQCEIAETEQNLKSLQDQAVTTNATLARIDEAGAKLQNIGSSLENVGKKKDPTNMDGNTKTRIPLKPGCRNTSRLFLCPFLRGEGEAA